MSDKFYQGDLFLSDKDPRKGGEGYFRVDAAYGHPVGGHAASINAFTSSKFTVPTRDFLTYEGPSRCKTLHAGDSLFDQSYIRLEPDYVGLVGNGYGTYDCSITCTKLLGNVLFGPTAILAALPNIRIGFDHCFNPMWESYIPSTAATPIPALQYCGPFKPNVQRALDNFNEQITGDPGKSGRRMV